jgi:hypothetical protein
MAVAKTNPLPVGLYTMDLPASSAPRLAAWTKGNRGKVVVRKVVANERDSSCAVVFEVIGKPGAFPFGAVGYPTIATSSAGSMLDDPFGWINESASQLEGLALLFVLWQLMKR